MTVAKDFLGNVLEAGNTMAYAVSKDSLVLFKILEVKPDGTLLACRLDNNPSNKASPPLGRNYWKELPEFYHNRAVKLWLSFEVNKQ